LLRLDDGYDDDDPDDQPQPPADLLSSTPVDNPHRNYPG